MRSPNTVSSASTSAQSLGRRALVRQEHDDVGEVALDELVGDAVGRLELVAELDLRRCASGLTMEAVCAVTVPMKPIRTPSTSSIAYSSSAGVSVPRK